MLKKSMQQTSKEFIPPVRTNSRKKWMTGDILQLMDTRRRNKENNDEYKRLNKEIVVKCNEAKEAWLKERCKEIELQQKGDAKAIYKQIEELTGRKTQSKTGCLR